MSSSLTLVCLGRLATFFKVAMKCVQNAITVVLGAKVSVARQLVKFDCMYKPNIFNQVDISTIFRGSL